MLRGTIKPRQIILDDENSRDENFFFIIFVYLYRKFNSLINVHLYFQKHQMKRTPVQDLWPVYQRYIYLVKSSLISWFDTQQRYNLT